MTIQLSSLSAASDLSARDIKRLTDAIDRIMPLVFVREQFRDRSIMADDAEIEGRLFSPEAFATIRAGTLSTFPVDDNLIAIDGRLIRNFIPFWDEIVKVLGLTGEAKIRPVDEVTSRDIRDSIARLSQARDALVELIPEGKAQKKSGRGLLAFLVIGAGALIINYKS